MAQYIDKSAVVAEIKRRISLFKKEKKIEKCSAGASQINVVSLGARIAMLEKILCFLDTLKVKEVDFETEWKKYFEHKGNLATINVKDLAKHFFELGLNFKKDLKKAMED